MIIDIQVGNVQKAHEDLRRIQRGLTHGTFDTGRIGLNGFSPVTGFYEAASQLGRISDKRNTEALSVLADHLRDVAEVSQSNLDNVMLADGSFADMTRGIWDLAPAGLSMGDWGESFASAKAVNSKAGFIVATEPVVGPQMSLPGLDVHMRWSKPELAQAEASFWQQMALKLNETITALYPVLNLYATSEAGWVSKGMSRINQIQRASGEYLAHAEAMSLHAEALSMVTAAKQIEVSAAHGFLETIPLPSARAAFEASYLAAFPALATAELVPTVPLFRKLLPDLDHVPGDPFSVSEIKTPTVTAASRGELPKTVKDAFIAAGHHALANASSAAEVVSQYGRPNPDVLNAIAAGATPTQAAAVAAPSMPPSLTPGIANAPVGGFGGGLPQGGGMQGVTGPVGTVGSVGAMGAGAGSSASSASRAGGIGPAGGMGYAGAPAGAPVGGAAGTHRGGAGFGRGPLVAGPGAAGAGVAGAGNFGGFSSGGAGYGALGMSGANGAYGSGGASGGNSANQSRTTAVAGGPMAGGAAGNRGEEKKKAKVKTVTSAVERDGNLRSLLGEAPLLLPTVIGHNVRQ